MITTTTTPLTLSSLETLPDDILFLFLQEVPQLRHASKTMHLAAERLDHHLLMNFVGMGPSEQKQSQRQKGPHSHHRHNTHEEDDPPIPTQFDEQLLLDVLLNDKIVSTFLAKRSYKVGMSREYIAMLNDVDKLNASSKASPAKLVVSDRAMMLFLKRDVCFFDKRHIITPEPENEIETVAKRHVSGSSKSWGGEKEGNNAGIDKEGNNISGSSTNDNKLYEWQHITDPAIAPGSQTCVYAQNVHWLWLQYRTRLAPGRRYQMYLNLKTDNAFSLSPIRFMVQENPYVKQTFQPFAPVEATAGQHGVLGNVETKGGDIYMGDIDVLIPPPAELVEVKEHASLENRNNPGSNKMGHRGCDGGDEMEISSEDDDNDNDDDDDGSDFVYYHDETLSYECADVSGTSSPVNTTTQVQPQTLPNVGMVRNSRSQTSLSSLSHVSLSAYTAARSYPSQASHNHHDSHGHNSRNHRHLHSSSPENTLNSVPHLQLHRQLQQIETEQALEERLEQLPDGTAEKQRVHRRLLRQKYGKGGSASGSSSVAAISAVVSAVESRSQSRSVSGAATPMRPAYTGSSSSSVPKQSLPPPLSSSLNKPLNSLLIDQQRKQQEKEKRRELKKKVQKSKSFVAKHPVLRQMRREDRHARRLQELARRPRPPSKWPTVVFEMEDTGVGINRGIQFNYLYFVPVADYESDMGMGSAGGGTSGSNSSFQWGQGFRQWAVVQGEQVPNFIQPRHVDYEMRQAFDRLTEFKNTTALGTALDFGLNGLVGPDELAASGFENRFAEKQLEQLADSTGAGSVSENSGEELI